MPCFATFSLELVIFGFPDAFFNSLVEDVWSLIAVAVGIVD